MDCWEAGLGLFLFFFVRSDSGSKAHLLTSTLSRNPVAKRSHCCGIAWPLIHSREAGTGARNAGTLITTPNGAKATGGTMSTRAPSRNGTTQGTRRRITSRAPGSRKQDPRGELGHLGTTSTLLAMACRTRRRHTPTGPAAATRLATMRCPPRTAQNAGHTAVVRP